MEKQAPKNALKFLRWFCKDEHLEEVEGNLIELYEIQSEVPEKNADWAFYKNVLLHFRPEYLRFTISKSPFNQAVMFNNYFKIAYRNISKDKLFSAINIAGLVLGMVCFLFIYLWVEDEKSIDNFHHNGERLFNVYETMHANGKVFGSYKTLFNVDGNNYTHIPIEGAKEAVPEIESIAFYASGYELPWGYPETFKLGNKLHKLKGSRANDDFLNLLNYPIIAGDRNTPLSDVSSIAISRKMANLFFKNPAEAIGKTILFEDRLDLKITAVFEDVPQQSSLKFDYLINWELNKKRVLNWASDRILTTVQLAENADIKKVETNINRFLQTHLNLNSDTKFEIGLQAYGAKYLEGNFVNGKPQGGRIEYVRTFSGVALFILFLACINFMNLSTARASKRSKEVGVRKVIGSTRFNLIRQFLGESILLSFIALFCSILLISFLLPYFNDFTGKQITLPYADPSYWVVALGLMILTGIAAGSYPAFFLSALKPAKVLKGVFQANNTSKWLRKGLTVFQFSLSIFLLVAALVVSRQADYIKNTHLGYDKENLLYVRVEGELMKQQKYNIFKNKALTMPGIAMVDKSSEAPHTMNFVVADPINWEGKPKDAKVGFKPSSVGYDFVKLMNLEIVEGRDFSNAISTDSATAFLVNEEAIRQMEMQNPIGKWVSAWNKKGNIIGILKDYHTHSLHEKIKPVIIDVKEYEQFGVILVRTKPGETREAIGSLEKVYQAVNPNYAFHFEFIDQEYEALYKSEQVAAKLSNIFAFLAIMVSCLGLLGLVIFSVGRRFKEISIRKVLGASIHQIVLLLSKDFLIILAFAFVLTAPLSWFIMNDWLQGFPYRIHLSWWIFVFAGIMVAGIALIIVSSQSFKAALANPVDSLKQE